MTRCDPNDFTGSDLERIGAAIRVSRGAGGTVCIPARRPYRIVVFGYPIFDLTLRQQRLY